uniref:Uncharacterized protein n=1 Tax=Triticum urartu TaxID=4572 RepID=A0A8R7K0U4_TRIUA
MQVSVHHFLKLDTDADTIWMMNYLYLQTFKKASRKIVMLSFLFRCVLCPLACDMTERCLLDNICEIAFSLFTWYAKPQRIICSRISVPSSFNYTTPSRTLMSAGPFTTDSL